MLRIVEVHIGGLNSTHVARRIFIQHHHGVITTLRLLVAAVCSAALRDGLVRSNEMIFFAIQTLLSSRRALRLVVA